jgi:hypothetical protein
VHINSDHMSALQGSTCSWLYEFITSGSFQEGCWHTHFHFTYDTFSVALFSPFWNITLGTNYLYNKFLNRKPRQVPRTKPITNIGKIFSSFFFGDSEAWTQGLHLAPLHQTPFLCVSVKCSFDTECCKVLPGLLLNNNSPDLCLLSSARIIGMRQWLPEGKYIYSLCLCRREIRIFVKLLY